MILQKQLSEEIKLIYIQELQYIPEHKLAEMIYCKER
jgi:hypothetical protein